MGYVKYEEYNELFCKHLCEEVKKFEECPTMEHLKKVKDLIEVINGLNEMEMDEAVRKMAEHYGYDSNTKTFRDVDCDPRYDSAMEFMEMFNASHGRSGRDTRSRRDSRGRFIANAYPHHMPPYYPDGTEDYPWEYPYYMMNDGREHMRSDEMGRRTGDTSRREFSGDRRTMRNGGRSPSYPNGSNMDENGMYMLWQENGMPIMTPYNMSHDIPKKLTDKECEEWMQDLINFDGSQGPKWTKAQVEAEAKRAGIDVNKYGLCLMAALTNSMYADFGHVARIYNADKPSFYIRMAEAFLDDKDFDGNGGAEKASIYFHKIVEHE